MRVALRGGCRFHVGISHLAVLVAYWGVEVERPVAVCREPLLLVNVTTHPISVIQLGGLKYAPVQVKRDCLIYVGPILRGMTVRPPDNFIHYR